MPKPSALSSLSSKENLQLQQRKSLGERTTRSLRELILLEKLPAGLSLPERDLADALGISRTPMREAIQVLERGGLIKHSATREPHFANPSLAELAQNLAVIGTLKALGGELACANACDKDLSHIIALNDHMKQTTDKDAPLELFRIDIKFHNSIMAASGNAPLVETHRQYNTRLWRARFISSRMRTRRDNTLQQHKDIVNVITNLDAKAASAAVRTHLEVAIKYITKALNDKERGKIANETAYWNNPG